MCFGPVGCKPTVLDLLFSIRSLVWALLVANLQPHIISFCVFGPVGCKPTVWYLLFSIPTLVWALLVANLQPHICFFSIPTCVFGPVGRKPTVWYLLLSIPALVWALLVANLQPHVVFVQSPHLFGPCWLQTYSLMSFLFNPHTCLGPAGCKPTASYQFCSIPTCVLALLVANLQSDIYCFQSPHLFGPCWLQTYSLMSFLFNPRTCLGPAGCKPTASCRFCSIPTLVWALLVANLQPHVVFVQSPHLFGPCWLQTYSLMSFLFNPHTCLGPAGCKPTASCRFCSIPTLVRALLVANLQPHVVFVQSPHLFGPCWLQTYSLMSFLFNPHTCLGPAGCKPTASCRFCSIPTLVRALLVANLQPHVVFVQSPHLFGPCWLQTYSLMSFLFNPHTCLGPAGGKPTASCRFCSIPTLVWALLVANLQPHVVFVQSPHLFGPCWLQTYSLISVFFRSPHLFGPCWLQTYSLISVFFNPHNCFGPVGCKPTASYQFFSIPTCVFGPVGCKPTVWYLLFSIPTLVWALLVANLQSDIYCFQSPHCTLVCALLVANLQPHISFFNPHMCFWPCWLQTYSLISIVFNPRTCLGPAGCKPTASCRFCSIPTLVWALLVANLQPHVVFVQSPHLFGPCWLQTYSLMSFLFNPHTCLGPAGCKPTASCRFCSIPTLVWALLVANLQPYI